MIDSSETRNHTNKNTARTARENIFSFTQCKYHWHLLLGNCHLNTYIEDKSLERWKRLISSFHVCNLLNNNTVIITQNFRPKPYVALVINLISRNRSLLLIAFRTTQDTPHRDTHTLTHSAEKMQIGHERFSWNWAFVSLQIISVDILSVVESWLRWYVWSLLCAAIFFGSLACLGRCYMIS